MLKSTFVCFALMAFVAFVSFAGCKAEEPAPQPVAVAPVMPMPQPIAPPQVTPPPPTPLMPVVQEAPAAAPSKGPGGGGSSSNVDAKIKGPATTGEELLGNYNCALDSKKVDFPLGVKLPPFGCRIYQAGDGTYKLGPTSQSMASISGTITDPKAAGFHVVGKATFAGQSLDIKLRMSRKGTGTFEGSGKGAMNDAKKSAVTYSLVMKKSQ